MTPDERIVQAFLVADDVLRRGLPTVTDALGIHIVPDDRMPLGMAAFGTANGSIVVRELP